jgi:hypothetical protein
MKNICCLSEMDDAVAGIVVAVMIVGLIIAVISIVQTLYVPKWMEQIESEHMDEVADQFIMLKNAIDTQVSFERFTPVNTPITLGCKELPFLVSSKAFGDLAILEDKFELHIGYDILGERYDYFCKTDALSYLSGNSYYLDQSYTLEAGALILSQNDGNVMTIEPAFYAEKDSIPNSYNISFNLIDTVSKGDKTTVSGYGTYSVQTQYLNSTDEFVNDILFFNITTAYPYIWERFINDTLNNSGMEYGQDGHYTISKRNEWGDVWKITYDFKVGVFVDFYLKRSYISAQIAPS